MMVINEIIEHIKRSGCEFIDCVVLGLIEATCSLQKTRAT